MRTHANRSVCLTAGIVAYCCVPALGQWVEQSFNLVTGWNSAYIEVDPADAAADVVFVTSPGDVINRVWSWQPALAGIGIACPDPAAPECQPSTESGWRLWLPPSDPDAVTLNNLFVVRGGQVYLIVATASATLTVRGNPTASKTRWLTDFNVAGFHVDDANPPTFAAYLGPSTAHANTQVFDLDTAGNLTEITDLTTAIVPKRGYWVSSATNTDYDGPLDIDSVSLRGLDYGRRITEYLVQFENRADQPRTVTFSLAQSLTPPTQPPNLPSDAGVIPMKWRDYETNPGALFELRNLDPANPTADFDVPASSPTNDALRIVRLSVDRRGQTLAEIDPNTGLGSEYQSVLTIKDGAGFRRWLSVTAEVANRAGLYAGTVTVDHVAWVQAGARIVTDPLEFGGFLNPNIVNNPETGNATELRPTTNPFVFPVIIHFDGATTYTFLREVTLLFKPPQGLTPGNFVLATPDCPGCDDLLAGSIVDGERFARRMASAAFSFEDDIVLTGDFDTKLEGVTVVAKTDRLNPFRHSFHPDHDGDFAGEIWGVTRTFGLSFTCNPPSGGPGELPFVCGSKPDELDRPGRGDFFLTGCYYETFSGEGGEAGLHKNDIDVCGKFDLRRISAIPVLNDGR